MGFRISNAPEVTFFIEMEEKKCSKCKEVKPIHDFHKARKRKDGLGSYCKLCGCRNSAVMRSKYHTRNVSIKTHTGDKKCIKCNEVKSVDNFFKDISCKDGLYSICKPCDYDRKRNAKNHKSAAREKVGIAIKRGVLQSQPCIVCGHKAEAHHSDYSKPLDVDWLCRKHHVLWHRYLTPYNN